MFGNEINSLYVYVENYKLKCATTYLGIKRKRQSINPILLENTIAHNGLTTNRKAITTNIVEP